MEDRQAFGRELRRYVIGLVLALVLSGAALALVAWAPLPPYGLLGVIAGLALLQVVAHVRAAPQAATLAPSLTLHEQPCLQLTALHVYILAGCCLAASARSRVPPCLSTRGCSCHLSYHLPVSQTRCCTALHTAWCLTVVIRCSRAVQCCSP